MQLKERLDLIKQVGEEIITEDDLVKLLDKKKNPILAIIPGNCKLSFNKIKEVSGAKKVRLVPFTEAENYSGYLPGATPVVNHKLPMKVILDQNLTKYDSIYGGGGVRTKLLEMKTDDVIRLNNAIIADITE